MTSSHVTCAVAALALVAAVPSVFAESAPLTADRSVEIALKQSPQGVSARAAAIDARSSVYSAYSGVLPRLSGTLSRSGTWTNNQRGSRVFGGVPFSLGASDEEDYATTPSLTGSWNVLNLSSITGLRS